MTTRKGPKPVRLWALVNRNGRTPYTVWSVMANTRADIEFRYLYWMCGTSGPKADAERERFRVALKERRYTIERVTVTPERAP